MATHLDIILFIVPIVIMVFLKYDGNYHSEVKRNGKTHKDLRYDIKCIELNQNYYII
jgi:hypothetical protein